MKKSLCILTSQHEDYDFIKNIKYNDTYYIKSIVFNTTVDLIKDNTEIEIYSLNDLYKCINEADAFYLPSNDNYSEKDKDKYLNYAISKGKEIICNKKINKRNNLEYKKVDIPILLIIGIGQDIEKFSFVLKLKKYWKDKGEKVSFISGNKHSAVYGIHKYPVEDIYSFNDVNKRIRFINSYINQVVEREHPELLVISLPGGIRNPNIYFDYRTEFLLLELIRACQIDYLIKILPINFCNEQSLLEINNLIRKVFLLDIDICIITNIYYDITVKVSKTRTQLPKIHISKYIVDNKLNELGEYKKSMVLSSLDLNVCSKINNDILKKLKPKDEKFWII